jgi:hypothetical protein
LEITVCGNILVSIGQEAALYSQWGLIPKNPFADSRGSFRAVRIGNTNKNVVVDPTVK